MWLDEMNVQCQVCAVPPGDQCTASLNGPTAAVGFFTVLQHEQPSCDGLLAPERVEQLSNFRSLRGSCEVEQPTALIKWGALNGFHFQRNVLNQYVTVYATG
jgi:hypothetical protein